jgi:hypothetical protein
MSEQVPLPRESLRTPRAAAIAGILFSVLLITSLVLIRSSVPADSGAAGRWLAAGGRNVTLALNLVPFAGIAFLWFIGVLRDRIGEHEDRFFATVFLGSGLMFLAMLFGSAAVAGGMIVGAAADTGQPLDESVYTYSRGVTYTFMNIYAIKMAGVFMISTATISVRTKVIPRWISMMGYVVAAVLLVSIGYITWAAVLFPLWILLLSVYLLVDNLRRRSDTVTTDPTGGTP